MINEITNHLINKIIAEKEAVINKLLFQYLGFDLDIEKESQKRFPRLVRTIQGDEEVYYWNDGTDNGKRIVTFYVSTGMESLSKNHFSIKSEIKFY